MILFHWFCSLYLSEKIRKKVDYCQMSLCCQIPIRSNPLARYRIAIQGKRENKFFHLFLFLTWRYWLNCMYSQKRKDEYLPTYQNFFYPWKKKLLCRREKYRRVKIAYLPRWIRKDIVKLIYLHIYLISVQFHPYIY